MNNENHETNLPCGDRRLSDSRGFQFDHFCASDLRLNSQGHSGIDREWSCEFKRRSEEQKWPKSLHVAMFESSTSRQISSKLKKTMPPVGRKKSGKTCFESCSEKHHVLLLFRFLQLHRKTEKKCKLRWLSSFGCCSRFESGGKGEWALVGSLGA